MHGTSCYLGISKKCGCSIGKTILSRPEHVKRSSYQLKPYERRLQKFRLISAHLLGLCDPTLPHYCNSLFYSKLQRATPTPSHLTFKPFDTKPPLAKFLGRNFFSKNRLETLAQRVPDRNFWRVDKLCRKLVTESSEILVGYPWLRISGVFLLKYFLPKNFASGDLVSKGLNSLL